MIKITKATNNQAGITLLSLIITIIILLILATVAMSTFKGDGIIKNSQKAVDMAKVESMREEIKMAIINKIVKNDREITIEQIIEQLEKQDIIKAGDCNKETGQVKTQPDGYVYEIKEKANGDWEVTYIGNGELTLPELLIALSPNTTGITNSVTITMTAKAESGISSYTLPKGTEQSVESGTKEITKTYTATENGTYTFTVTNGNGKTESKSITIDNILEGVIVISASPTTPTKGKVTVTVTWPSEASSAIKEMQVGEGSWQVCSGGISSVEVMVNCTVKARVRNSVEEIKTATCEITNIDKTNPTVTAKEEAVTITEGDSHSLGEYFTITANGTYGIASTVYTDISNGNAVVSNTNTLAVGTHTIKCTATKETGASAYASVTIVVESAFVDANGLATAPYIIQPDATNPNLQIVIPAGFAPAVLTSETDGSVASIMPADQWSSITAEQINQGIVVVDHAITYTDGVPDFNEYVWVPITGSGRNTFAREAWTIGTSTTPQDITNSGYWEDTNSDEYTNMLTSVSRNKGFYISRYEASRKGIGVGAMAQSKRGQRPWSGVDPSSAIEGAANNPTANTHLMYGIEWDSTLNWLIASGAKTEFEIQTDSSSWGNYTDSSKNTGYSETWKANNIYNLAGNLTEWTQEKYSTDEYCRCLRGGAYEADFPAAERAWEIIDDIHFGFRFSFYL